MKKIFLVLYLLMIYTNLIKAQYIAAGPFTGMNINFIKGINNPTPQYAPSSGILLYYREQYLSLQSGLLYTNRGARWKILNNDSVNVSEELSLHLQYLEIPFQFGFRLFSYVEDTARFRPKILIGPIFGMLTSANQTTISRKTNNTGQSQSLSVRSDFKPFDIGITVTGGLNWKITDRARINFDAGYRLGLLNINRISGREEILKNRNFSFLIGITMRISRKD